MKKFDLKRNINLHHYIACLQRLMSEWKLLLPLCISIAGIIVGTILIKGEGSLYEKIGFFVEEYWLSSNYNSIAMSLIIHLLIPTTFAFIVFFIGLSVYGGIMANTVPLLFSLLTGLVTYYMYSEYKLKGLAYCVIMVFPYTTLSLFSLILITAESISMSQYLLHILSTKRKKMPDYSINKYYINSIKSYIIIVIAAVVKTGIEYLFVGLFNF